MRAEHKAARDSILAALGLAALTAFLLWLAWMTDWVPNPRTFTRVISAMILAGFVLLLVLYMTLVAIWRLDVYAGRPLSPLHFPSIASAGTLTFYFGLASISAVDVFYKPTESWPLLRDPGIRMIATLLIFGIVGSKAWMLYEIVRGSNGRSGRE